MDREMSAKLKKLNYSKRWIWYSGQKFGITKLRNWKKRIDLEILLYENSSKAFKEIKENC